MVLLLSLVFDLSVVTPSRSSEWLEAAATDGAKRDHTGQAKPSRLFYDNNILSRE